MNPAISNFISKSQQALAVVDDSAQLLGGLYWQASRLCQMDGNWQPVKNGDDTYAMLVTDEELSAAGFAFTAQELGAALFGAIDIMYAIPSELADIIGKVRA